MFKDMKKGLEPVRKEQDRSRALAFGCLNLNPAATY